MVISLDYDQQLLAWNAFVDHQELLEGLNPVIAKSWWRCRGRMHPDQARPLKRLSADHLLASQVASFDLISIARPIMEDIYQYVERSDSAIALVNSAGYILDILGDPETIDYARHFEISAGALVSEAEMGTNAFGLALTERIPVSVVGAEHYLRRFHDLAEAAAPIFHLTGRPLGALGLINPVYRYHPHTLGVVVAGARAIEGQRQSDYLLAEQNKQMAQLNAILAANSEGVLVWNAERLLMHINPAASRIMGLPGQALLGRRFGEYVHYPDFLNEVIDKRQPITDEEINIEVDGRPVSCVISLRYVLNEDELVWIICTARQEKDVRRLVHSQVGAQASLTLADLPGESLQMKRVRRFIKTAAPAEASILIRGESGTGKNPTASAIHNESPRRDGPFLIFACSSVPSELVVRELLGFDEGVSSQAPGGRPSKFELANGGTIYFQDVEALPLEAQGVLINVIDLGIVQRLGSTRPIPVDVRIIASSSANIEQLIAQGSYRSDLFYRLSSFEIRLPPLRERRKDLPLLLARIMRRLSQQINRDLNLRPEAVELLEKYDFPGNIRELEAVLGRAAVQAGFSGWIGAAHLPDHIRHPVVNQAASSGSLKMQALCEIEREAIIRAAELCRGNVSEMARMLGISRTTVWRRLKTFGVSLESYRNSE